VVFYILKRDKNKPKHSIQVFMFRFERREKKHIKTIYKI